VGGQVEEEGRERGVKPIRLKKDNVVHTVHSGVNRVRLATGADVQRTVANPSGTGWPSCWVCTERRMKEQQEGKFVGAFGEATWVPVEEYGIADKRANEEDLYAKCSHGNPGGRVYEEVKTLTMPKGWSETKRALKRCGLVFFMGSAGEPLENKVLA
jgi:hypothetical protein